MGKISLRRNCLRHWMGEQKTLIVRISAVSYPEYYGCPEKDTFHFHEKSTQRINNGWSLITEIRNFLSVWDPRICQMLHLADYNSGLIDRVYTVLKSFVIIMVHLSVSTHLLSVIDHSFPLSSEFFSYSSLLLTFLLCVTVLITSGWGERGGGGVRYLGVKRVIGTGDYVCIWRHWVTTEKNGLDDHKNE